MTETKPTQEQLSAYFFNNCSKEITELVENWFYHHGRSQDATDFLHGLWLELGSYYSIEDNADIRDAFDSFKSRLFQLPASKPKSSFLKRLQLLFRRIVAILFIPLLVSTLYFCFSKTNNHDVVWLEKSVAYGEIEKLTLPDGSVVWLNSGSTIIYPSEFLSDVRQIFFEGEGYFDVYKNPDSPMNIHVKGNLVKVHGTTFNLKAYQDERFLELSLMEGSVSFSSASSMDEMHFLSPGESLTYDSLNDKITHSCFSKDNVHIWKEGGLYFKNKTLEDIVHQLERTYDIRIVIVNEELRDIKYHMAFVNNESIDDILQFIDNDSRIVVSRKGDIVEIY